jgi:hypothetical protein
VAAREIRTNLLYVALGRDAYVKYAQWYQAEAQKAVAAAEVRKVGQGEPFDDSPEDDDIWRAHTLALEEAVDEAVLEKGMVQPKYAEVEQGLGPYQRLLVHEIVQWNREDPDEGKPNEEKKFSSGNSVPP